MKTFFRPLVIALSSLVLMPAAGARTMPDYTFESRFAGSDLIVIARPVTKTTDTKERTNFEGLVELRRDREQVPVAAVGVETKFIVLKVIKGDATTKEFVLHHYRGLPPPAGMLSVEGPSVVAFDPADNRKRRDILLFLVRESDGRYAPFGGQNDPGIQAIYALEPPP
jgi:hypothetical protein